MLKQVLQKYGGARDIPQWPMKAFECLLVALYIHLGINELRMGLAHSGYVSYVAAGITLIAGQTVCACLIWRWRWKEHSCLTAIMCVSALSSLAEHWLKWRAGQEEVHWYVQRAVFAAAFLTIFIFQVRLYHSQAAAKPPSDGGYQDIKFDPESRF